jgi:putative ABC transport system permease protein
MLSISLGVASLVAVRSFRADMARSIGEEAQILMGSDIRLTGRAPLEGVGRRLVDSLAAEGHGVASSVSTPSMVLAEGSGEVRLLQVRAVEGDWPFYGEIRTTPAGLWGALPAGDALVDPAVLVQLDARTGDTIQVGAARFRIAGTVENLPADVGFQSAVGPRVYLARSALDDTGILAFGSLVRYRTFAALPGDMDAARIETRYDRELTANQVELDTAEEEARDLTDAVGFLGRYLGLVGLGALLLGGIGVGSAIHVFVKDRLTEVAVLRCLGASQGSVFFAYVLQAGALGLGGATLGAVLGVGLQQALPGLLEGVLPVTVTPVISPATAAGGILVGVWVALAFSLLPLLTVRDAPPLRALRHTLEPAREGGDPWRIGAILAIAVSVAVLCVQEAPSVREGLVFAGSLAAVVALLWGTAHLLSRGARRFTPSRARYEVRQGLSNLFRPGNQTVAVTLALGFGSFVVATVLLVRANLARELELQMVQGQPNVLLFDIQEDQREAVLDILPVEGGGAAEVTPLIFSRLAAVNGRTPEELLRLPYEEQPAGWAMRRDYRHTVRDTLTGAETLLAGSWWSDAPEVEEGVARISLETELAEDLRVGVGDRLTWEVSGVQVESEVVSLRSVDWGQFQTNFFVVFEPGSLDGAPASYVVLATLPDGPERTAFQRTLLARFPNVSALDLTRIQETLQGLLTRVGQGIAFLAGFAAVAGLLVLAGALASSRHQRLLEGALLRTLGARRGQVLAVLFAEYAALGVLATLAGLILAVTASGLLVRFAFQLPFTLDAGIVLGIWAGVTALTVTTGLLGSRDLLRRPPLPVLRGE